MLLASEQQVEDNRIDETLPHSCAKTTVPIPSAEVREAFPEPDNDMGFPPLMKPAPACIQRVKTFEELRTTPFAGSVNALCWERTLPGDFGEVVARLGGTEGVMPLGDEQLLALPLNAAGQTAVEFLLADQRLLRAHDLDPVLNCIRGYPRDDAAEAVPTDVYSFHTDRAPVSADTWLCTYYGPASEGLRSDEARRRVDVAATRAELLKRFGGEDDDDFREYLRERCYDLHYIPIANAQPFSFGVGHLWRIAIDYPGSPVQPCVHRAPATHPGQPRLLLIS